MKKIIYLGALLCASPAFADTESALEFAIKGMGQTVAHNTVAHSHVSVVKRRIGGVVASYYGGGEKLNRHTASGARFRAGGLTAAHRSLPFGTKLLVSRGNRQVVVVVNDRGPAAYTGRSLDLSRGAAMRLGMIGKGVDRVQVAIIR